MTEEKKEKKEKLSWEAKYKLLKALHEAHVEATDKLEKKYHKLVDQSEQQKKLLINAQAAVDNYKQIMINSLNKHNEDMHHAAERDKELKFAGKTMQAPR